MLFLPVIRAKFTTHPTQSGALTISQNKEISNNPATNQFLKHFFPIAATNAKSFYHLPKWRHQRVIYRLERQMIQTKTYWKVMRLVAKSPVWIICCSRTLLWDDTLLFILRTGHYTSLARLYAALPRTTHAKTLAKNYL